MEPVREVVGRAIPLDRSDVDTDTILPTAWLKAIGRTGFADGLFAEWRKDPDFVLNDEARAGASILVTGPNFGIGSSREHAAWALLEYGFRVVISPRFGDIFRNNAAKAGLIPAVVDEQFGRELMDMVAQSPGSRLSIDVTTRRIAAAPGSLEGQFSLDEAVRQRFLHGLDDIDLTLKSEEAIGAYEKARAAWLPTTYRKVAL